MSESSKPMTATILVVSESPESLHSITKLLAERDWRVITRPLNNIKNEKTDPQEINLALIHTSCEQLHGTLRGVRELYPQLEVIFLPTDTEHMDMLPIQQLRLFDIIDTDISRTQLLLKVETALRLTQSSQSLQRMKQQIAMSYGFDNLVGESKAMRKITSTIKRIAATDITVLLSGPNGTGKNVTARIVHHHSGRRKQPLVVVECSSIPTELFEDTLFGRSDTDGVYIGGLLQQADKGTLFFNDIDKLPAKIQAKLHDVMLQNSIPGEVVPRTYDIRYISATAVDLNRMAEQGEFLESLYYQLAVMPIQLPALGKRMEDIEHLAHYFCRKAAYEMKREYINISAAALELLLTYPWPGNVRELENTMKRAATLAHDNMIEPNHIVFIHKHEQPIISKQVNTTSDNNGERLEEGQRKLILKALHQNNWNFTHTASELGIGRTTLWRKVKKFNLQKETV